jgi:RimJ/RimL family protein N-acetyltransferase
MQAQMPIPTMTIEPVQLRGAAAHLVPLSLEHLPDLWAVVAADRSLLQWFTHPVETVEQLHEYIAEALAAHKAGSALPFAILDPTSGRAIGSTRYGNIDRKNRRLEIGWTFLGRPFQRTAVNTQCKLLLLRHAFATLGAIRVEFKTDSLNLQSRAALQRLGAVEEGILRNHMITASGRLRHSVYFSVIAQEWPALERTLEQRLAQSQA